MTRNSTWNKEECASVSDAGRAQPHTTDLYQSWRVIRQVSTGQRQATHDQARGRTESGSESESQPIPLAIGSSLSFGNRCNVTLIHLSYSLCYRYARVLRWTGGRHISAIEVHSRQLGTRSSSL